MEHIGTDVSKKQYKTGTHESLSKDACVTRSDWYPQGPRQKNGLCHVTSKYATLFSGNG
jgi:hypothetical protein